MKEKLLELLPFIFAGIIVLSLVYFPVTIYSMDELTKAGLTKESFLAILVASFFLISIPPLMMITGDDGAEKIKQVGSIVLATISAASFIYFTSLLFQDNTTVIIINSIK